MVASELAFCEVTYSRISCIPCMYVTTASGVKLLSCPAAYWYSLCCGYTQGSALFDKDGVLRRQTDRHTYHTFTE